MAGEKVSYIVTCEFKDDVEPAKKLAQEQGGFIEKTFTVMPGFLVQMPADSIRTLANSPHVKSVEPDSIVTIQ